jgi:cytidylate kinase
VAVTRRVEEIVEHQVRRWHLEQRGARERPAPPCIALSRLPGSGGAELGHRVAEKLDFGFFGIELLDQIARERGVQRRLLEGLDERVRGVIDRYVLDAFRHGAFTETEYLRCVVHTISTLGERGGAVILGRGAPFILAPDRALRVLVTAPLDARIERTTRAGNVSNEQARDALQREEAERRQFLGFHFHVDPDDPRLFDLVVNTGTLGIDDAAALVVEALRRRFGAAAS